jgi:16S rRNA G966 N2-methylase RsmD
MKYNKRVKTLLRLFPYIEDKEKAARLKIDEESIHFISVREYAERITDIIKYYLNLLNIDAKDSTITDATAGVGGNTLSFGMHFKHVNAIELDEKRSNYLQNNVDIYGLKNINVCTGDSIKILPTLDNQDVVFLDPPWGGKNYKEHEFLRLQLSDVSIETLCNGMMDPKWMKQCPAIIVYKLPINYDIKYFYENVNSNLMYYHNLKKMSLIIIINPNVVGVE